jgi:hypothetical protein
MGSGSDPRLAPQGGALIFLHEIKTTGQITFPEAKDFKQPATNEDPMNQGAKNAPGHHIVHFIFHDDASFNGFKTMFVVPKGKGPYALFIHKAGQNFDMLDLSEPAHRNAENGPNAVFDHESGMNDIWNFTQDFEIQKRGRHGFQVLGGRKEGPCLIERDGKKLGLMNAVNFQGLFLSTANFGSERHSY